GRAVEADAWHQLRVAVIVGLLRLSLPDAPAAVGEALGRFAGAKQNQLADGQGAQGADADFDEIAAVAVRGLPLTPALSPGGRGSHRAGATPRCPTHGAPPSHPLHRRTWTLA